MRQFCPLHTMDDVQGRRLDDGSYEFTCDEPDHPGGGRRQWLVIPPPPDAAGVAGLGAELGLDTNLPAALASLGHGWFEYGLVERAYAQQYPADFAVMVQRWGHTAIKAKQYTASAYIASVLGRLASNGVVAYHSGRGTGRWAYNADISYWSTDPSADWDARTTWAAVLGDGEPGKQACRDYVPGA